jgi:DNA-binding transcriptional MerR regulator
MLQAYCSFVICKSFSLRQPTNGYELEKKLVKKLTLTLRQGLSLHHKTRQVEVERYSVKKLASLAGVSVRTLHVYDEIGLLKPSVRTEKKYRLYGKAEAIRLQQILFYKALGMPLKQIGEILDDPHFDPIKSLENHKRLIQQKQDQLATLLKTIDKTISHLKNKAMLSIEELFEGLPKEEAMQRRQEAITKWGNSVERSENHLRKKTKEEFAQLKADAQANTQRLLAMKDKDPTSAEVQVEISTHYELIREFWGTAGSPDKNADAYSGLGDLYVSDERYTTVNGKAYPVFAQFLNQAMKHFAKKLKQLE